MHISRLLVLTAGAVLVMAQWLSPVSAQQYVVTEIMSGLDNPRGLAFGPDGGLYVAEAGRGGTKPTSIVVEGQSRFFGTTSALSRLLGGVQQRVLSDFPSLANSNGTNAGGLQDIVFNSSGEAFGLIGAGANPAARASLGSAGASIGTLVRLPLTGGSLQTIADLVAYEGAQNPDGGVVDSNPFKLLLNPAGGFVVGDAGANAVFGVTAAGDISTLTALPPRPNPLPFGPPVFQSVPTAVALGPDGATYVGELTGFPFPSGAANVYRLDPTTGARTVAHSGFTNIVDLAFGPDDSLYVLQISTNGLASPMGPGPGSLIKVDSDTGMRTTIASQGLSFPTGLAIGPDGAFYVSNMGSAPGSGQVLSLTPIPEPSSLILLALGMIAVAVGCFARRLNGN
ncbi:MAG: ScyD/ScyE family protein [Pirellulales bacterium]